MIHTIKNKYIIRSRISEAKTREIIKLFCLDIEASKIAKLSNISCQSINKIIKQIRILIAKRMWKNLYIKWRNRDWWELFFASFHLQLQAEGGYTKHRLAKFKGIKKENFLLHLKETEFRYNTKIKGQDLYKILLKMIRNNPLKLNWAKAKYLFLHLLS